MRVRSAAETTSWVRGAGKPRVAVIGAGVSGLSCAWLLNPACEVVVYEADRRVGGHAHTVQVSASSQGPAAAVDTGFIVYNEANYPNLTALFRHIAAPTRPAAMSFGVSLDDGGLEYGSTHPLSLFAQPANLVSARFWSMLTDLVRFYREAPGLLDALAARPLTLGEVLDQGGYGQPFQEDHLLPQIGAIWSASPAAARDYPAEALIRFFDNHGLLNLLRRPQWRTLQGGSRVYVDRLIAPFADRIRTGARVVEVRRTPSDVRVVDQAGRTDSFDQVVIAAHADQALAMLHAPSDEEQSILGAFRYSRNRAVLHEDPTLMPRRRGAWSAWNHIGRRDAPEAFCVTYWMNRLQDLPQQRDLFVTLNPCRPPRRDAVVGEWTYDHPLFDREALQAQRRLWSLQGRGGVWFCGAHFGAGFHEDGLQAGLAVAEQLAGVRRPWRVAEESGRIHLDTGDAPTARGGAVSPERRVARA